ncbi:MAG TPA: hypothetical protein VFV33_14175, partial [Gemmatimonadaceae bacterium]|nr:hypothetical protein [Gemmatimonadaceae bacterium]
MIIESTLPQSRLDTFAASRLCDHAARELAHMRTYDEPLPVSPAGYAGLYLLALAEVLGVRSGDQCAEGETWDPADWLDGDREAIERSADALGVTLD